MSQSVLTRTFTVSLLLHAGLIGLLALEVSRRPLLSDAPLRVRILEPPVPSTAAEPPPAAEARPKAGRGPIEVPRPGVQAAKPQLPTERLAPRPIPAPDKPPVPEKPAVADTPVAPAPTPQVTAPPVPEPAAPRTEKIPEPPRQSLPPAAPVPAAPGRGGLSLGGPPPGGQALPGTKGSHSPAAPPRPSLREQIASLGSALTDDLGGTAKRTINLDSRDERYLDYLARVKRRIERVWGYPEEALTHGVSGELLLVFTLNRAGTLTSVRLIQSSGFPILDEEALRAVKLAAPYDAFPPQMGDEPWNISASFRYNLPRRLRRN